MWLTFDKDKLILFARFLLREDDVSFFFLDSSSKLTQWLSILDLDHTRVHTHSARVRCTLFHAHTQYTRTYTHMHAHAHMGYYTRKKLTPS